MFLLYSDDHLFDKVIYMKLAPLPSLLGSKTLDMLFPPQCLACGDLVQQHGGMCQPCWSGLHFITTPKCAICSFPFEYDLGEGALCAECIRETPIYDSAYSLLKFDEASKPLLHKLKFEDGGHVAPILARWLSNYIREHIKADMITAVPLSRLRLLKRRYNQSAIVSKIIAKQCHINYQPMLIKRVKHTPPQTGLTRPQRIDNMRGAFALNKEAIEKLDGKSVILLDDVMTTGATLEACCKQLHKANVKAIHVITLARVIHTI